MKNFPFDGIGFVTNRGKSKYWGVAQDLTDLKSWRVTINHLESVTTTFLFVERVSETEAAKVAACMYNGINDLPVRFCIDTGNNIYIVNRSTRKIETFSDCTTAKLICNHMIKHEDLVNELNILPIDQEDNEVSSEEQLVLDLFGLIKNNELSPRIANLIKEMLDIYSK